MSDRLLKLLQDIEWAGQVCCPKCKALAPFKMKNFRGDKISGGGVHEPWCTLNKTIKELKNE